MGKQCISCNIIGWKKYIVTCRSRWVWEIEAAGILDCFEERFFDKGSAKK